MATTARETHEPLTAAEEPTEETPLVGSQERYSSFGGYEKLFIILTATFASTFSPLSANIYFPAINAIGRDLHIGPDLLNLTITSYMIFQGLAPTFVGTLSDNIGRRPVYILCFVIYIIANIGLAVQDSYPALLLLRCLQSTGSSPTVSLSYAIAADVVTSAERGMYVGLASVGPILGPSVGPIAGGLISQYLGWRWIFWFLAIAAVAFFIPLLIFFPETCRKVVGDGSIPPTAWNKSLLVYMSEQRKKRDGIPIDYQKRDELAAKRGNVNFPNPFYTLKLLFEYPTGLVLMYNGVLFAGYYAVTSSLATLMKKSYDFDDLQTGLAFIPIGTGTIIAAIANGYLVDWNYRRIAAQHGTKIIKGAKQDLSHLPVEKARLQIAMPMVYLSASALVVYGWVLQYHLHVMAPMIILFIFGFAGTASYNIMNVLIVDLNYSAPATATAANNLVRCFLGAGATAIIEPVLRSIGQGWTFSLIAIIWVAISPSMLLLIYKGKSKDNFEETDSD